MDPNAEEKTPSATISEVDVEVESAGQTYHIHFINRQPAALPRQPTFEPLSASSIFRGAFENRPQPGGGPASSISSPPGSDEATSEDPEKTRQRYEEEFQRKLRGEYEAAQQRIGEVVTGNMDRPLRLHAIRLSPPPPTSRPGFLNTLLSPFLVPSNPLFYPTPPPPRTLHEILLSTRSMVGYLDRFGVWDMQRCVLRLEHTPGGDEDQVDLVLALKEKGRLFLKAGTEVGGGEGGGNVTARIRNALGGGETLEANASLGTKTKSAYQLSLTTPLFASPLLSFALSGFSLDRDNTAFSSHREQSQGGRARFSANMPWGDHDVSYEYVQREVASLAPGASVSVRELAVPSTKSSLSHTFTRDTRDDPWMGTSGQLLKATHEYAGLPGSSDSVHFCKSTFQTQMSRALYQGSSIHYSMSSLTTMVMPLSSGLTTPLPDRTYLGGPNSVRGFKIGGLGQRDGQDSLGGDLGWAMGLSLMGPFPGKPTRDGWGLRWHSFVNAGKVVGYNQDRSFTENMVKMYRSPSLSVGLGLMYRLDPVRVEVNFSVPLIARKGERLARGFGIGVGLEFL